MTAACVLAEVGNPGAYASAEALCADVGVVPGAWQSGQTSLTHRGCDPRGKRPKVALVAAMRKLLTALYAISKRQTRFVEPVLALLHECA